MGAVNFSLDIQLVDALFALLPLNTLVETGTFRGDTVESFKSKFKKIISIELSEALYTEARQRFQEHSHIQILHGDSQSVLREIQPQLQSSSILYWLDAHWCVASDTAGDLSQCPLLGELKAIGSINEQSILLIDDARLFLAPPLAPHEISQWPSFHQVLESLLTISSTHEVMVVNDMIIFLPLQAKAALIAYAQSSGIDWLEASNCLKQSGTFMSALEEKERFIQEQNQLSLEHTTKLQKIIQEKDCLIQEQHKIINAYHAAYGTRLLAPLRPLARALRRVEEIIRPRLGNLNQYAPRPLTSSKKNIDTLLAQPKISIVTPSFQQGDFIERTLRSVLDQKYPNLEFYIQDGGSTDNTVDIIKLYENSLSGWVSEKDEGQSHAINLGFAKTSGDIMAWLNSDDLLLPGTLAYVANYFVKHPEIDVIYGNRLLVDENGMEIGRWILPGHDGKVLSWVDYIPQETMFWRRQIWDRAGGQIDESFRFAMDWDLLIRFRDAGAKFAHINQFLGAFRIHEQQKTSAAINDVGHSEMDRIRERVLGQIPSRSKIRKASFPFLLRHVMVDMIYRVKTRLRTGA